MGDTTTISWTDKTFNPWIGCQKVSPGCDNCYAEKMTARYGWTKWGPHGTRKLTSDANWRKPVTWNNKAARTGKRSRVFCASLADVFDNKAPSGARQRLFELIKSTPFLDWQLLTKRPQNIIKFLPEDWNDGYANVWLGITAENQKEYDRRWKILQAIPASCRFISYEPALGPLELNNPNGLGWLIWGGESGAGYRIMNYQWAEQITAQCISLGIAVFGKQWGGYKSNQFVQQGMEISEAIQIDPPTNGKGGALLNGRMYRQFPDNRRIN